MTYNEILSYINSAINANKFINIGGLLRHLDGSPLSYQEKVILLEKAHYYNLKIIKETETENKELLNPNHYGTNNVNLSSNYEKEIISKEKTIDINVNFLIEGIMNMNNFDEIRDYLNGVINGDKYLDTINKMIAHLLEEQVAIKKLRNEEYYENKKYSSIFNDELNRISFLLNCLFSLQYQERNEQTQKNIICYLTTDSNNLSITNDLKDIPIEYYDSFYSLLLSIQNGNFKNFKRIGTSTNNYKSSLLEVKEHQTRIVFNQLEANIFMILTIFLKKVNISKDYSINIKNVDNLFARKQHEISNALKNNRCEFIELSNKITDNLCLKLLTKNKEMNIDDFYRRKNL